MTKFKKYLFVMLMAFVALVLVGCGDKKEEEPKLPAPTEITINYDIYDGTELDPYVLVGGVMYLSAEVNEGADPEVTWSMENTDKAELTVEDGSAVITAKAAGSVLITCTSVADTNVSVSERVKILLTEDNNLVLTDAYNEIVNQLPEFVDSTFDLPKVSNDMISILYLSKMKDQWTDGKFDYASAYKNVDVEYGFFVKITYRNESVTYNLTVKLVGDKDNNKFVNLGKAQQIVDEFMSKYVDTNGFIFNETAEGVEVGAEWNSTSLPALLLPGDTTAEQTGEPVSIRWETDLVTNPSLELKKYEVVVEGENPEDKTIETSYYITYKKALIDTRYTFTAFFQLGEDIAKSTYNITCDGYDAEEVVQYFLENNLTLPAEFKLTGQFTSVYGIDTTKKFPLVTVEYTTEDDDFLVLTPVKKTDSLGNEYIESYRVVARSKGEGELIATFYYDKKVSISDVPMVDENGDFVTDENGNLLTEKKETVSYAYKYEYVIKFSK